MRWEESCSYEHDQDAAPVQLLHGCEGVRGNGHGEGLAEVDLPRPGAGAGLGLGLLDGTKAALLLGERSLELGVGIVLDETLGGELFRGSGEDGLAEVLGAKLADEGQAGRGEEHLLADLGGVGDVGDGGEVWCGVVAAKEGVEGFIGLEVRLEGREVVGEGRGGPREELDGFEGLGVDCGEEAKVVVGGEESVELGDELLGGCYVLASGARENEGIRGLAVGVARTYQRCLTA